MKEKLQQEIFDLIDGLLPIHKRKEIEKLLETDQDAAAFYVEMKALRSRLGSLPGVKTSPDFDSELRARIRMEKHIGRVGLIPDYIRVPSLAFVGAAAVMLLFFAFGPKSGTISLHSQPGISSGFQNTEDSQQTYYTMDRVDLNGNGGGTQLSSEGQHRAASRRDSMRSNDKFERHIRSVEF